MTGIGKRHEMKKRKEIEKIKKKIIKKIQIIITIIKYRHLGAFYFSLTHNLQRL